MQANLCFAKEAASNKLCLFVCFFRTHTMFFHPPPRFLLFFVASKQIMFCKGAKYIMWLSLLYFAFIFANVFLFFHPPHLLVFWCKLNIFCVLANYILQAVCTWLFVCSSHTFTIVYFVVQYILQLFCKCLFFHSPPFVIIFWCK